MSMKKIDLETMSVDDLWSLHEQISKILSARITSEKRELEKRLAVLNRGIEGADASRKALELQRATGREPEDVDAFLKDMAAQQRIIYEFDPKRVYGSYEPGAENRATR